MTDADNLTGEQQRAGAKPGSMATRAGAATSPRPIPTEPWTIDPAMVNPMMIAISTPVTAATLLGLR